MQKKVAKLSEKPIALSSLEELIEKENDDFKYVRVFMCDIIEAMIMAGEVTKIKEPVKLSGIERYRKNQYNVKFSKYGRSFPIRIFNNGVLEISDGPFMRSRRSFADCYIEKSQAGHLCRHVVALVVAYDSSYPNGIRSDLYYRIDHKKRSSWVLRPVNDTHLSSKEASDLIEKLSTDSCIHKFERESFTGWGKIKNVTDRCAFCGEERERKPTKQEQEKHTRWIKQLDKTHSLYHKVVERLKNLEGEKAIEEAEKLEKKYEGHVQLVPCDDDAHASSGLLLVDHENDDHYWGTSVIYLPQVMGKRETFFLYPHHRNWLMNALKTIKKKEEAHGKKKRS